MTVKEMIAELRKYDPDSQVVITWEGTVDRICPTNIYPTNCPGYSYVVIDGDGNSYREQLQDGRIDVRIAVGDYLVRDVAQPPVAEED